MEQMERVPAAAIPPRTDLDRQHIKDWLVPLGKWPAEAPPPTIQQVMEAMAKAPAPSPRSQPPAATPAMVDPAQIAPTAPMLPSQVEMIPGPNSVVS